EVRLPTGARSLLLLALACRTVGLDSPYFTRRRWFPKAGRSCSAHDRNRSIKIRPDNLVCAAGSGTGSTETHRCQKLPIDQAVRRHIVVAFVSANCSSRLRPHDPIDGTMIVPGTSKPALHLYNRVGIAVAISVVVVPVVSVRIVPVIGIR